LFFLLVVVNFVVSSFSLSVAFATKQNKRENNSRKDLPFVIHSFIPSFIHSFIPSFCNSFFSSGLDNGADDVGPLLIFVGRGDREGVRSILGDDAERKAFVVLSVQHLNVLHRLQVDLSHRIDVLLFRKKKERKTIRSTHKQRMEEIKREREFKRVQEREAPNVWLSKVIQVGRNETKESVFPSSESTISLLAHETLFDDVRLSDALTLLQVDRPFKDPLQFELFRFVLGKQKDQTIRRLEHRPRPFILSSCQSRASTNCRMNE